MIPPANVELTKVFYYDKTKAHRNMEVPSISREIYRNDGNTIIKRNVFGHTWVLKINETDADGRDDKNRCDAKVIVYVWVFCCIVVAICFGVYFSLESKFSEKTSDGASEVVPKHVTDWPLDGYFTYRAENGGEASTNDEPEEDGRNCTTNQSVTHRIVCDECDRREEICLKLEEVETPKCVRIIDDKDPTGCGGLCEINTQHCRLLDIEVGIYQCAKNRNVLHCPAGHFNCGNRCITQDKRCDGVIHCSNRADEQNCDCDLSDHFLCGNETSCIANAKRCDGFIDCWDKFDELGCSEECAEDESPCDDGQCIEKRHFCDGVHHCKDGSDEPQGCRK